MIRSLYSRVIFTFMGAVIVGLISAFYLTNWFFRDQVIHTINDELLQNAKDLVETYGMTRGVEVDKFLRAHYSVRGNVVTLIDASGQRYRFDDQHSENVKPIPEEAIRRVLDGQPYQSNEEEPESLLAGYPLSAEDREYALFVQPGELHMAYLIRRMVLTSLAIVLIVGSLLLAVAARYLVQPLKRMTWATQRLAKGDFNVNLEWKPRKDELGELAQSFSHMASELGQMEQMRRDFVSNVSHEIQSPLTSIAGFSKVLRSRPMPEEERNRYLDIITTESERLSRLSDNLLKLASLESEHHPFHPRTYGLDEQLRRVIVSLEPQWTAKKQKLELKLPSVKVAADEDQLNQVWINLLGNASKFTPEEGTIRITLQPLTDRVRVRIEDNGIGITPEEQARIFDRFYKADRSHNRAQGGSGLGLAIAKRIVELHRGTIEVSSQPGQSTVFTVTLPSVSVKRG